jgi:hypothetical protein
MHSRLLAWSPLFCLALGCAPLPPPGPPNAEVSLTSPGPFVVENPGSASLTLNDISSGLLYAAFDTEVRSFREGEEPVSRMTLLISSREPCVLGNFVEDEDYLDISFEKPGDAGFVAGEVFQGDGLTIRTEWDGLAWTHDGPNRGEAFFLRNDFELDRLTAVLMDDGRTSIAITSVDDDQLTAVVTAHLVSDVKDFEIGLVDEIAPVDITVEANLIAARRCDTYFDD